MIKHKSLMEVDNPRARLVSHMSTEREKQFILALKSIFLVMIFCGSALAAFPFYAWLQLNCFLLLLLSSSGVFAVATGLVGVIGAGRTEEDLNRRPKSERYLAIIAGQDILMLGLYMSLCLTAACLVLGAEVYFFKGDSLQGIISHETLITSESALSASGWIGCLTAGLSACTIPCMIALSLDYDCIHTVVQMCNYVLMITGIGIAHIAAVYLRYRDEMDIDEILPGWVLWFAFITGAELVIFAFYGFYVTYYEHPSTVRVYGGLNLVFMIGLLICCLVFGHFSALFDQELPYSCLDTMAIIDQEYMGTIGCPDKYIARNYTAEALPCQNEEIRLIWEDNVGVLAAARSTEYGCLNTDCCPLVATNSDLRFHILLLLSLTAFVYAGLCLTTSCYLVDKVIRNARAALHTADVKVLVLMVCTVVAGSALFFAVIPEVPLNPYKHAKTLVLDAGYLDPRFLADGVCIRPPQFQISQPNCTDCESTYIYANLTTVDGKLMYPARPGISVSVEGNMVSFKSLDADLLSKMLKRLTFCPYCLEVPSALHVTISTLFTHIGRRLTYHDMPGLLRRLQEETEGGPNNSTNTGDDTEGDEAEDSDEVEVTPKRQEIVGLNQTFQLLANAAKITLTRQILQLDSPLEGVTATLSRPHCSDIVATTNSQGLFSMELPRLNDFTPYYVPLKLHKEGYVATYLTERIGGIPIYNYTEASIYLPEASQFTGDIVGTTVSVLSNLPLSSVLVQLRSGYNNSTGPVISQTAVGLNGTFTFVGLPAGAYSLTSSKVGYFSDISDIVLEGNTTESLTMLMSPQNINRNMLRVTLSWRTQQDVDLQLAFVVNDDDTCELSSLDKECGGGKLTTIETQGGLVGGESITLKEVGPYIYAFYLTQRIGESHALSESEAEIEVYVESSIMPVTRLSIPRFLSPTRKWLAFCINGLEGITSLIPIQLYLMKEASPTEFCAEVFGTPEWISEGTNVTEIEASPKVGDALPNLVWQQRA